MSETSQKLREVWATKLGEALAEYEVRQLKQSTQLVEQWGSVVPKEDYPFYDADQFRYRSGVGSRTVRPFTSVSDRIDGDYLPVYRDEFELREARASARALAAFTSTAIGAVSALTNYTIGTGYSFTAIPRNENSRNAQLDALLSDVQFVLDEQFERIDFVGDLDLELHERSREDGEAFVAIYPKPGDLCDIRVIEPDEITEPANKLGLERWLGTIDRFQSFWKYGVHTRYDARMKTEDVDKPLGYHVVFDDDGSEWDYVPTDRMLHIKRNVPRRAKRGISDFIPILRDLEREAKLRRNTAEGAATQAAITFIREHLPAAGKSDIEDFVSERLGFDTTKANNKTGTTTRRVEVYDSPVIKDVPAGMKYHAGPLGTLRSPVFIEVAQYLLRIIGTRWSMPEFLISGDASNNNFASSLVAEAPFVKARERDQNFYSKRYRAFAWMLLKHAHRAGFFKRYNIDFDRLKRLVEISVETPEPKSRDAYAQAQTDEVLQRLGVKSKRSIATGHGLDFDEETENMQDETPVSPMGAGSGGMLPSALAKAFESLNSEEERRAFVESLGG